MVEKFLMKKGQVINAIASDFLKKSVGDKVPSISEYQEELEVARGTVQNAISYLKNEGAFKLISKGHQGSFISEINYEILQSYALSETVLGTMTLPYSKLYEGLATGIYEEFRNRSIVFVASCLIKEVWCCAKCYLEEIRTIESDKNCG